MYETIPLISQRKIYLYEEMERWYQAAVIALALAALALGAYTFVLHRQLRVVELQMVEPEDYDAVYDGVMKDYEAVRDHPYLRRYLIATIKSLAAEHEIDPDLLFSVVAVESSFRVVAKSPKNARGLGQVMFQTAKALNPDTVSRPDDLYDVHLNLDTVLKYLKANLAQTGDDLRKSLLVYYYGDVARRPGFQDRDQYVRKVMDCYARLQQRRRAPEGAGPIIEARYRPAG